MIQRATENPANTSLRVTDTTIARDLGISVRQAQRDRAALELRIGQSESREYLGAPSALQFDKKRLSWTYTREVNLSEWVGLLNDESLGSLIVAKQALAVFSGMPLARRVAEIFEHKAGGLIGNTDSRIEAELSKVVSFYPDGAGKVDPEKFAVLFRALLLGQQVRVRYQSNRSSRPKERILSPYHLCCFKHQWRLIAHDSLSGEIRTFVVTPRRLRSIELLPKPAKRPADFSPMAYLTGGNPKERVVLKVSAAGVHHVLEREWVGLRSTKRLKGGALEAIFEIADREEFKRLLLAFGSDCEVVEPRSLREEIRVEAQRMLKLHS